MVDVKARLLPITKDHKVFLLFSGKPNFHKLSKSDVFILIPDVLPG